MRAPRKRNKESVRVNVNKSGMPETKRKKLQGKKKRRHHAWRLMRYRACNLVGSRGSGRTSSSCSGSRVLGWRGGWEKGTEGNGRGRVGTRGVLVPRIMFTWGSVSLFRRSGLSDVWNSWTWFGTETESFGTACFFTCFFSARFLFCEPMSGHSCRKPWQAAMARLMFSPFRSSP